MLCVYASVMLVFGAVCMLEEGKKKRGAGNRRKEKLEEEDYCMHHTGARHEFRTTDYCAINSVYEGSVVLLSAPRRHEATVKRLLLLLNMASFMLRSGLSKVGVVVAIAALVLCCASDASGNEQRKNEKRKRYFLNQGRELMKSVSTDGLGDSAPSLENHIKGPGALRFQSEQAQTQKGARRKVPKRNRNLQRKAQRKIKIFKEKRKEEIEIFKEKC